MSPRQTAIRNGDIIYEGKYCKQCGTTTKYTKYCQCVKCNYNEKRLESKILRLYGITSKDWLRMWEEQGGKCILPSCDFTHHNRWDEQGRNGFHIDHDHKTGIVRGLMCAEHNKNLGKIENNIAITYEMLDYIDGTFAYITWDDSTITRLQGYREVTLQG